MVPLCDGKWICYNAISFLQWEQLKEFHALHYHPSNAKYIYITKSCSWRNGPLYLFCDKVLSNSVQRVPVYTYQSGNWICIISQIVFDHINRISDHLVQILYIWWYATSATPGTNWPRCTSAIFKAQSSCSGAFGKEVARASKHVANVWYCKCCCENMSLLLATIPGWLSTWSHGSCVREANDYGCVLFVGQVSK